MGSISIWHWIIVGVVVLGPVVLAMLVWWAWSGTRKRKQMKQ